MLYGLLVAGRNVALRDYRDARSCSTTVQRETEMAPSTLRGAGGITGGYKSAAFIHSANPAFHLSFTDTKELLCPF